MGIPPPYKLALSSRGKFSFVLQMMMGYPDKLTVDSLAMVYQGKF